MTVRYSYGESRLTSPQKAVRLAAEVGLQIAELYGLAEAIFPPAPSSSSQGAPDGPRMVACTCWCHKHDARDCLCPCPKHLDGVPAAEPLPSMASPVVPPSCDHPSHRNPGLIVTCPECHHVGLKGAESNDRCVCRPGDLSCPGCEDGPNERSGEMADEMADEMTDEDEKDTRGPTRKILEDVINSPRFTTAKQWDRESADYKRALAVREEIQDEVAYARVLARRGWAPREEWFFEVDDPRMEAWQRIARGRAESAAQRALDLLADGVPSRLFEVGVALKDAASAVSLLAEHTPKPAPIPSPSCPSCGCIGPRADHACTSGGGRNTIVVGTAVLVPPIPTDDERLAAAERQPF